MKENQVSQAKEFRCVPFPGGSESKESACSTGDLGSVPGLGRSSGEGNGNPLQYSGPENSMDRGAWRAIVHEVPKNDMTEQLTLTIVIWLMMIIRHHWL